MSKRNLPYSIPNTITTILLGFFLSSFAACIVMTGVIAFILAILGAIMSSLFLRLVKIRLKSYVPALIAGYVSGLVLVVWFSEHWNLSVNLWASSTYVLSFGLTRVFLSDDLLTKWLDNHFPQAQNTSKNVP